MPLLCSLIRALLLNELRPRRVQLLSSWQWLRPVCGTVKGFHRAANGYHSQYRWLTIGAVIVLKHRSMKRKPNEKFINTPRSGCRENAIIRQLEPRWV